MGKSCVRARERAIHRKWLKDLWQRWMFSGWYENNCGLPYASMEFSFIYSLIPCVGSVYVYDVCEVAASRDMKTCSRTRQRIHGKFIINVAEASRVQSVRRKFFGTKIIDKCWNQIAKSLYHVEFCVDTQGERQPDRENEWTQQKKRSEQPRWFSRIIDSSVLVCQNKLEHGMHIIHVDLWTIFFSSCVVVCVNWRHEAITANRPPDAWVHF